MAALDQSLLHLERFGTALADPIRRPILLALLDGPTNPNEGLCEINTGQLNVSNYLAALELAIDQHELLGEGS